MPAERTSPPEEAERRQRPGQRADPPAGTIRRTPPEPQGDERPQRHRGRLRCMGRRGPCSARCGICAPLTGNPTQDAPLCGCTLPEEVWDVGYLIPAFRAPVAGAPAGGAALAARRNGAPRRPIACSRGGPHLQAPSPMCWRKLPPNAARAGRVTWLAKRRRRSGRLRHLALVNGAEQALQRDARMTLLDALRDGLHLTGTKKGCALG